LNSSGGVFKTDEVGQVQRGGPKRQFLVGRLCWITPNPVLSLESLDTCLVILRSVDRKTRPDQSYTLALTPSQSVKSIKKIYNNERASLHLCEIMSNLPVHKKYVNKILKMSKLK